MRSRIGLMFMAIMLAGCSQGPSNESNSSAIMSTMASVSEKGQETDPKKDITENTDSLIVIPTATDAKEASSESITEGTIENTTERYVESSESITESEQVAFPVSVTGQAIGEYYIGDTIDASDIWVTVEMSDGSTLTNPDGWAISTMVVENDYNEITICYGDLSSVFVIEARERETAPPATAPVKDGNVIVVLDPGHGGFDPGAINNTLVEKEMTLKVAMYCKAYLLENYTGVEVYMTRDTDTYLEKDETGKDIRTRCRLAASYGADAMVALHFNTNGGKSNGCLGLVSGAVGIYERAAGLSNDILAQLSYLGIANLGSDIYHNALGGDYYAVNRFSSELGMVGIIIEHCFIDNAIDVPFCDSDYDLQALGEADAKGIADYFSLQRK